MHRRIAERYLNYYTALLPGFSSRLCLILPNAVARLMQLESD